MSKQWKKMRAEELSAYVMQDEAHQQPGDFLLHLAKHGSEGDIHNFINHASNPLKAVFDLFYFVPPFAHSWMVAHLQNSKDVETHAQIALHTLQHMSELRTQNLDPLLVLNCVDFANIAPQNRLTIFRELVREGEFDIVRDHWDTYKDSLNEDLEDNVRFAAENCLDIRTRVQWEPQNATQRNAYFTACCNGGLVERAKECKISPNDKKLLRHTFFLTARRNPYASDVLHYLLDTYPQSQWFREKAILWSVNVVSADVRDRLLEYHKTHAPTFLKSFAPIMASVAIQDKNTQVLESLLPHVSSNAYHKLMSVAIAHRQKTVLKKLLSAPNSEKEFLKALKDIEEPKQQWAYKVVAETQNSMLRKEVKDSGVKKPTRKI